MKALKEPTGMGLKMAKIVKGTTHLCLSGIQSLMNESPAISLSKEAEAFLEAMSRISDHRQKIEVMVAMLRMLNKEDL